MNSVSSYFVKFAWGVRYVGYLDTGLICMAKLAHFASSRFRTDDWFWHFAESRFDKRLGVETVDMVPVEQMDVTEKQKLGVIRYEPTPFMEFGYVISRLPISHERYSFIDLGSGKGRALLMATKFRFSQIVGVEFSTALHRTAQGNLEHYRDQDATQRCRSICADATTFTFPDNPLVVFMFRPFGADILTRVINNLRRSYEQHPRHMIVVYGNPHHRHLFDESRFLVQTRTELNDWWLIYETKV